MKATEHEHSSIKTNEYIKDFQLKFSYHLIIYDCDIIFDDLRILSKDSKNLIGLSENVY